MVASDLYALKGLRLKNEAKLWVINRPWTPPNPQVPKEVIRSFAVSYIKNNEIVLRSLTVFARKRDLKISLTGAL